MKCAFLASCLFFALAVSAAEPSIYHDGWIDLDKNGKKDIYEDPAAAGPKTPLLICSSG